MGTVPVIFDEPTQRRCSVGVGSGVASAYAKAVEKSEQESGEI
jgi:hypothetical protein